MKIIALNGLLGYGYSEIGLEKAFSEKVDFVGVDAGSTDPGPYYLGSGQSFTDRGAVKRDLALALPKVLEQKAPFIIGTAGGAGSSVHVAWLKEIILEVAKEEGLHFTMGIVHSDVTNDYVLEKLDAGKLVNMSEEMPADREEICKSTRIVSQIGIAPIIKLLEEKVDVILCGRACDTAIYAAPCIYRGYDPGLAFHMAKIMECGSMCSEPVAAADVMQGYMYDDYFELRPANPKCRCTVDRVAAHTLYEQSNPYLIFEPDGVCDLTASKFIQVDERTVRVTGSVFHEAEEKTLKLEGVKCSGYRTICPPSVLGIGIGGTANVAANLAKEAACLRTVGSKNPDPIFAKIEEDLYEALNSLGIGIMGAGGDTSVLAVNVEYAYTHIAGIAVATSSNCMVARRATTRIAADNTVTIMSSPNWFGGR